MKLHKPFFLGLAVLSVATLVPFSKSTAQEKRPVFESRSGSKLPDTPKRPLPSGVMKIPFLKPAKITNEGLGSGGGQAVSNSMTETPAVIGDCLPEDVLEGDLTITTVEEWKASLDVCSVGGNLVVEGFDLSFVVFPKLRRVGGHLHVNNNPELAWIFLPLLKEVKGDIVFTHNFKLDIGNAEIGPSNLAGCQAFDKQNANVDLGPLQACASLISLSNQEQTKASDVQDLASGWQPTPEPKKYPAPVCPPGTVKEGDVTINATTKDMWELWDICKVNGNITVKETTLTGLYFPNLRYINGSLSVENNPKLASIKLPKLVEVKDDIVVKINPRLGITDQIIKSLKPAHPPNDEKHWGLMDQYNLSNVYFGPLGSFASLTFFHNYDTTVKKPLKLVYGAFKSYTGVKFAPGLRCDPGDVITGVQARVDQFVHALKLKCQYLHGGDSYDVTDEHWDSVASPIYDASIPQGDVLTKLWYKICEDGSICELSPGYRTLSEGKLVGETKMMSGSWGKGNKDTDAVVLDCGKHDEMITSISTHAKAVGVRCEKAIEIEDFLASYYE